MSSKSSAVKPEVRTGGMKSSASAPSSLPSAKTSQKSSLFDADDDDDDLFAPTKESRYFFFFFFQYIRKQTSTHNCIKFTLIMLHRIKYIHFQTL